MQRLFIVLFMTTLCAPAFAQHVYKIKTDSLLVTNDSCNAEFILENETKFVKGFLYNKGKGRTEFRKAFVKITDSTYRFGDDTLNFRSLLNTIGFSGTNIYNADGTLTGNRTINSNGNMLAITGNLSVGSGSNAGITTNATNFYMDGLTSGAGGFHFRNWSTVNLGDNASVGLFVAEGLTVSSGNTVASIAGTGVTSFRIGNTTSSSTWFFENHRNAPTGSLEISNSIENPGITLFPDRNVGIGSYTNNGYKLDVNGTGRFSANSNVLRSESGSAYTNLLTTNGSYWGGQVNITTEGRVEIINGYNNDYIIKASNANGGNGITKWLKFTETYGGLTNLSNIRLSNGGTGDIDLIHRHTFFNQTTGFLAGLNIADVTGNQNFTVTMGITEAQYYANTFNTAAFSIETSNEVRLQSPYQSTTGLNVTTGTYNNLRVSTLFAPTSGIGIYNGIVIDNTINQSGGANGITRGLYINPTLTSVSQYRAIEVVTGNTILGSTSGNVLIGTSTDAGYKLDVNGTTRIQSGLTVTGPAVFRGAPSYNKYVTITSDESNAFLNFVGDVGGIIQSSDKIQFYTQSAQTNFCTSNGLAYLQAKMHYVGGPYYATRLENSGGLGFQFVNVNSDIGIPGFHFDLPNGGSDNTSAFHITRSGTNLLNILPSGKVGIGNITPTSTLDVNGATGHSQFRLRTSYTPTSTSDTNGNTGDFSWDDNYFYIKTSAGWKRSALSTF